jgi:hypothetical protein
MRCGACKRRHDTVEQVRACHEQDGGAATSVQLRPRRPRELANDESPSPTPRAASKRASDPAPKVNRAKKTAKAKTTRSVRRESTREITSGPWKGRSERAIADAELLRRLKKKIK